MIYRLSNWRKYKVENREYRLLSTSLCFFQVFSQKKKRRLMSSIFAQIWSFRLFGILRLLFTPPSVSPNSIIESQMESKGFSLILSTRFFFLSLSFFLFFFFSFFLFCFVLPAWNTFRLFYTRYDHNEISYEYKQWSMSNYVLRFESKWHIVNPL